MTQEIISNTAISIDPYFTGDYKFSAISFSHGNWLICDGSSYNNSTYPSLASILGTTFNVMGDPLYTFRVPGYQAGAPAGNTSSLAPGHAGGGNAFGSMTGGSGGSGSITLTEANMPSLTVPNFVGSFTSTDSGHTHGKGSIADSGHTHTYYPGGSGLAGSGAAVNINNPTTGTSVNTSTGNAVITGSTATGYAVVTTTLVAGASNKFYNGANS
jgi:microcystin-dependent protein